MPRSSGAPVEARNGHYVGVGDGQLRVSFLVRQRVAQSFFRVFVFPLDDPTPCSTARITPAPDPVDNKGRFRIDEAQGTSDESDKGRFAAAKLVKGGIDYTQTNPLARVPATTRLPTRRDDSAPWCGEERAIGRAGSGLPAQR